jgi:hypothetical protein
MFLKQERILGKAQSNHNACFYLYSSGNEIMRAFVNLHGPHVSISKYKNKIM